MSVKFSPFGNQQFFDENGNPAVGWKLYTYLAGSSTLATTYTTSIGNTAQTNPIVINSLGFPTTGQVWLTEGVSYKLQLTNAADVVKKTEDNISGVNDATTPGQDEWIASGLTPTFISATSFSLLGDQTTIFQVGRRLKIATSGGTIYSTITVSAFTTLTTITVVNDSGVLDSGISSVSYSILSALHRSEPPLNVLVDQADPSKKLSFTISGLPTATTKTINATLPENICNGRLTLTTGLAITTADVTAAGSVYFTPFMGNKIATYNGNFWNINTFTEKTLAVPATTSRIFDVFIVDGTLALESLAWTDDTTRATALTTQDGILVKTGDTTRRYLGSFRTTAVANQTEDSVAKRHLWNYYNRVTRKMKVSEATANWTYTTATFRQARASTANQLDVLIGVSEDMINASAHSMATNSTTAPVGAVTGIGVDSTTVNSADIYLPGGYNPALTAPSRGARGEAHYSGYPGVGRHFLAWLEYSDIVAGVTTWYSTQDGAGLSLSGIFGTTKG